MATIKGFTSLEQSKKLAEILPFESADMHYNNLSITHGSDYVNDFNAELIDYNSAVKLLAKYTCNPLFEIIPCWSLSSLLNVLPYPQLSKDKLGSDKEGWMVSAYPDNCRYDSCWHDNQIDACYELILKLHNLNQI